MVLRGSLPSLGGLLPLRGPPGLNRRAQGESGCHVPNAPALALQGLPSSHTRLSSSVLFTPQLPGHPPTLTETQASCSLMWGGEPQDPCRRRVPQLGLKARGHSPGLSPQGLTPLAGSQLPCPHRGLSSRPPEPLPSLSIRPPPEVQHMSCGPNTMSQPHRRSVTVRNVAEHEISYISYLA